MSFPTAKKSRSRLRLIYSFRSTRDGSHILSPEEASLMKRVVGNDISMQDAASNATLIPNWTVPSTSNATITGFQNPITDAVIIPSCVEGMDIMCQSEVSSSILHSDSALRSETGAHMLTQKRSKEEENISDLNTICNKNDSFGEVSDIKPKARKKYDRETLLKLKNSHLSMEVHPRILEYADGRLVMKKKEKKKGYKLTKKIVDVGHQISGMSSQGKQTYDPIAEVTSTSQVKKQKTIDKKTSKISDDLHSAREIAVNIPHIVSSYEDNCGPNDVFEKLDVNMGVRCITQEPLSTEKVKTDCSVDFRATSAAFACSPNTEDLEAQIEYLLLQLCTDTSMGIICEIHSLPIDNNEDMNHVFNLLFNKAVQEPAMQLACARMIKVLTGVSCVEDLVYGNFEHQLRLMLVDRCSRQLVNKMEEGALLDTMLRDICIESDPAKKRDLLKNCMSIDKRQKKEFVSFIGLTVQLFKLKLLSSQMMQKCIKQLLSSNDEVSLECLCELFLSIGRELELVHRADLSEYFVRLEKIAYLHSERTLSAPLRALILRVIHQWKGTWRTLAL